MTNHGIRPNLSLSEAPYATPAHLLSYGSLALFVLLRLLVMVGVKLPAGLQWLVVGASCLLACLAIGLLHAARKKAEEAPGRFRKPKYGDIFAAYISIAIFLLILIFFYGMEHVIRLSSPAQTNASLAKKAEENLKAEVEDLVLTYKALAKAHASEKECVDGLENRLEFNNKFSYSNPYSKAGLSINPSLLVVSSTARVGADQQLERVTAKLGQASFAVLKDAQSGAFTGAVGMVKVLDGATGQESLRTFRKTF